MVIYWGVSFTETFLFSNTAFCSIWTCLIQKTISPHWLASVGFFILCLMTCELGQEACDDLLWTWEVWLHWFGPLSLWSQNHVSSAAWFTIHWRQQKSNPCCSAGFGLSFIFLLFGSPHSAPAKLPWELAGKLSAVNTARSDYRRASPVTQLAVSPYYFEATAISMNKKRRWAAYQ